ncbi:MAG: peptide deformylase [Mogibacterium sp.]|nr:peptide deformylase [Mogibacterium sp.]
MAIRNILTRGEEILNKKCKPVKEITPHIKEVMADMVDTMNNADGVGLAAPQIGIMKRFFVAMPFADMEEDDERRDLVLYMINPEITRREGSQESNEGCLSVPGYMGVVERPEKIHIKALDLDGNEREYDFEGFAATVCCHEYDHLEGVLYSERAKEMMTNEEYTRRQEAENEEEN